MSDKAFSKHRGRRVLIYGYTGGAKIDTSLIVGKQGIVLEKEGSGFIVFCPDVNRVLTFTNRQVDFIWRDIEVNQLRKYHKEHEESLYTSSQKKP
tara:strand:+ start:1118 stop:1402 length:285 start_codon:yes stop_codon:yes gene_type:complete